MTNLRRSDFRPKDLTNFWKAVDRRGEDECWLWQQKGTPYGYFSLQRKGNRRKIGAHRFAYMIAHWEVPDGLHVCHRCDNPVCVNPSHLFLGTAADNIADKVGKGRQTRGESHGPSKLNATTVLEIYNSDLSQSRAAAKYGCSAGTIQQIRQRKVWRHVTEGLR